MPGTVKGGHFFFAHPVDMDGGSRYRWLAGCGCPFGSSSWRQLAVDELELKTHNYFSKK